MTYDRPRPHATQKLSIVNVNAESKGQSEKRVPVTGFKDPHEAKTEPFPSDAEKREEPRPLREGRSPPTVRWAEPGPL